ncbi:MAG: DUF2155 domain-containing protein [Pseudomonadota bacterium]
MRASAAILLAAATLAVSACGEQEPTDDTVEVPVGDAADSNDIAVDDSAEELVDADVGATPLEERVATIGLLNKRNNLSEDFEMRPGETVESGPVIVTLAACERTAPWEMPQETGAFVQVDVLERGQSDHRRVFSGWLFKESPSRNVVEHPIYDVWVKDCAMSFPGDE